MKDLFRKKAILCLVYRQHSPGYIKEYLRERLKKLKRGGTPHGQIFFLLQPPQLTVSREHTRRRPDV